MTHTLGSPDSPIWFIINSPTEAEFKSGKLFNSAAGKILTASIRGNRVNKYFATCLRRSRKDSTAEILNNVIAIKNLYKQFKPAVVVLLGDEPLSLFESISSGKVANWRGSFLASSESFPSSLVLPTYTPETCRRQRFVDKDSHPGQYEMLLWLDIEKACKQLSPSAPTLFFPETKVLESSSEAKALLKQFISEGKPISYDLETYQPYSAHFVDCIGLANSLDIGFCIPFYFFNGQRPCPSFPYDDLAEIFELLAILMNSSHIEKVAQNSQFDSGCLQAHYGIETHNLTFDTMVAQQNIFCDLPKNLGCLTSIYTNTPYHKHLMGEARYVYCALDAVQNLLVRQGEEEQMKEWDIFEHYKTITAPTIQPILQMQLSGVKVDESKVEDVRSWRHEEVSAIQSAFDSVLPFSINPKGKYKINLNSPDQKKFFFNELLGCKPMKVKGKITCNKSFLKKIEAEGAS